MTLTRRDRAAMVLALEWVRVTRDRGGGPFVAVEQALDLLWHGRETARAVERSGRVSKPRAEEDGDLDLRRRLLRARLALYLRAVLRANRVDADGNADPDYGPHRDVAGMLGHCERCGWTQGAGEVDNGNPNCHGMGTTRRIRPLWDRAPKTRAR